MARPTEEHVPAFSLSRDREAQNVAVEALGGVEVIGVHRRFENLFRRETGIRHGVDALR